MPKHQHKSYSNSQNNMPSSETSNSSTIVQKKCNRAEVQNKNFKKTIMNMFKDLKDNSNKDLKEICENTTVQ